MTDMTINRTANPTAKAIIENIAATPLSGATNYGDPTLHRERGNWYVFAARTYGGDPMKTGSIKSIPCRKLPDFLLREEVETLTRGGCSNYTAIKIIGRAIYRYRNKMVRCGVYSGTEQGVITGETFEAQD